MELDRDLLFSLVKEYVNSALDSFKTEIDTISSRFLFDVISHNLHELRDCSSRIDYKGNYLIKEFELIMSYCYYQYFSDDDCEEV